MLPGKIMKNDAGEWHYMQGDTIVRVDPDSILRTIDAMDRCSASVWVAIAVNSGLPADPFERRLLKPVLMGILQNAWYEAFNQPAGIPEKCLVNQRLRVETYLANLKEHVKKLEAGDIKKDDQPVRSLGSGRGASYRLNIATKPTWSKFIGQKGVLVGAFEAFGAVSPNGGGITTAVLADAIKDKLTTVQPADRVASYYINVWKAEGIIQVVI